MFENLGPALSLLRDLHRLSQAEVARRAGIGKSQLSKYEGNREYPKLDSLEKVLNVLEVSPAGLFNVVSVLDGWAAGVGAEEQGKYALALMPRSPGLGFPMMDQAFQSFFADLLILHRATLEVVLRAGAGGRPEYAIGGPDFGVGSGRD